MGVSQQQSVWFVPPISERLKDVSDPPPSELTPSTALASSSVVASSVSSITFFLEMDQSGFWLSDTDSDVVSVL